MNEKLMELLIHALVLFTAVPVHECAHVWAAHKLGDDTGKDQGRLTLNPLAHLDLWGSLMLVIVGFGWGRPAPVDPRNFKNPKKGMMLSALAGPVSNFIMAFLAMIVYRVLSWIAYVGGNSIIDALSTVFVYITLINISLGVFNFLPIPPLDGSKIFNAVLPERIYFKIMSYERYIFLALMILIYSGLLNGPLGFLQSIAVDVMLFLTGWVDNLMGVLL